MKPTRERTPTTDEFCAYLRGERELKALTLAEISRITKVPAPSLRRLETGKFDELPAEVFVRGFLRSYAQCLGLDPEDVVRRYRDARTQSADVIVFEDRTRARDEDDDEAPEVVTIEPTGSRNDNAPRSRLHATGSFIYGQLFDERETGPRRGAVTLAVIILVIVATLTMSYLLRRPSSVGDGLTTIDPIEHVEDTKSV